MGRGHAHGWLDAAITPRYAIADADCFADAVRQPAAPRRREPLRCFHYAARYFCIEIHPFIGVIADDSSFECERYHLVLSSDSHFS